MAIGVEENQLLREISKRLLTPIEPVEIGCADAPVQQVVKLENAADLTELPVHLQHGDDGAPYISATLDFSTDPKNNRTNVGMRRLMLRVANRLVSI